MPREPTPCPAQLLDEAIRWCEGRADPAEPARCLRDLAHMPWPFAGGPAAIVDDFLEHRRTLVAARPPLGQRPARGRLVACFPDRQLADGAPQAQSAGFFDACNTPPWDTWVAYEHDPAGGWDLLLAWVPHALVPCADEGVKVCCDESLEWIDAPEAWRVPALKARLQLWAEVARAATSPRSPTR